MLPPHSDGQTRATQRIERLKTDEIQMGSVRRETLTGQQIERLRKLQVALAEVDDSPIERWIDDFRYDANPDREIGVFEAVAEAYQAFCSARPRDLAQKKDAFGLLLDRAGSTYEDSLKNYELRVLSIAEAKEVLSYYKMHLVQQLTPLTCGLACVESVSFDLGSPITQAEILRRYKDLLIGCANNKLEHFGQISGQHLEHLLNDLGFRTSVDQDRGHDHVRDALLSLSEKQAAIISIHFNNSIWHFVRWVGFQDDHSLVVMNPAFSLPRATLEVYSLDDFVKWDLSLLVITAP
jgi:hypothetical protein